jgi:L-threonylcarbamoyladenylate synthase
MRQSTHPISTDLDLAVAHLRAGRCVGLPTETVYGLAANALDVRAVTQIFQIKNRPTFDPLIVHVADAAAVARYATQFPEPLRRLAAKFWPGPLTVLLPRQAIIPDLVTSGLDRVALRAPAHPMAQALLRRLDFPLAAPSANPFGYISPTTAQHVADQLGEQVPLVLDGGPCHVGVESTIVGWEADQVVAYRLGGLAIEDIEREVGPVRIQLNQSSNPAAPGMLHTHYAPHKSLILNDVEKNMARYADQKIGLLTLRPYPTPPLGGVAVALSPTGDLAEAAQHLFAAMRQLDAADVAVILAENVPDEGLGRAINDRLRRAAARR